MMVMDYPSIALGLETQAQVEAVVALGGVTLQGLHDVDLTSP
nr:hypothetical protein [Sphingomonas sp. CDS-1]